MENKIEEYCLAHIEILNKMLFMTSHKVRKPIATCLGFIQILDPAYSTKISKEELIMIFESIKPSILELDNYVKELNDYLTDAKLKEKTRLKP